MIVGTAGHVDHGKTALMQGLTGIATDRLKEEQARGLTIEAGYAYPDPPPQYGDVTLGFIDVPGHERFIANMLSGAAGIQAMLLVVAADDGIMPQTVEHARILELLGVTRAWVALTKIDRVEPARVAQITQELRAWLAATPFSGAPIFPLSNTTGEGIDALRHVLWTTASDLSQGGASSSAAMASAGSGRFRLAVDRVFVKQGAGVVVTGTVRSGQLSSGDRVKLLPAGLTARVRGLRCQNRDVETAKRGDRCAINLSGADIERGRLERGDWVVAERSRVEDRVRLDVTLKALPETPELTHWMPVHLHHVSAHVTGRLSLLEGEVLAANGTMLAQLVLDSPLQTVHGDIVVVRDQGARHTLAGARVLDVAPPRRGARKAARLRWLSALRSILPGASEVPSIDELWANIDDGEGIDLDALAANLDLPTETLQASAQRSGWQVIANRATRFAFPASALMSLYDQVLNCLTAVHDQEPAMRGAEIDRLRRMSAPRLPPDLFRPLLERWVAQGTIVQHGPFVALTTHRATMAEADLARWELVRPQLAASPFEPPRVRDIAQRLAWDERETRRLLHNAALLGEVYQLRQDHFFLACHVAELADRVRELDACSPVGATASDFRDGIGCGRKLAVAILEFFDRVGFTRRIGDGHKVIRGDMLFD
ncbi:selenocysteine-specific translation elongation factor [Salinicola halophyticus]|uniref:selenocysteine-specific translation elongation factor n=1 Tax=Salinicola halophyticus TaxID=1808881 RepID=UPI000DA18766|nr:selenocysteine-specific translation elongation factor [Salinicola halophyticus]